ncbi:MAG: chromosomal replication initiator protein DnaA, partial [Bacteroidaceae bacterium]|nr:chromosomal replication initiator protein DnaA [Bacteroidaceae bacterium]
IQAIGIKIKEQNPEMRVLYVTSRVFESQYTNAVRKNLVIDFINFYQSIDVLIIDDIQELAGKTATQNTFYHIFNFLHQNGRQLILSSDCPPVDMDGMIPRLISRFKWGITVELQRPDYELRKDVLLMHSSRDGLEIPVDVLDFIAKNVTDSVRELEGVVASLLAHATIMNREINLDLAKMVISNTVKTTKKQINFDIIAETVCRHFGIETDLIYGKCRRSNINDARQVVMYLARKYTQMSSVNIGARLSRDHATVLHACNKVEEMLPFDKMLQQKVTDIEQELGFAS